MGSSFENILRVLAASSTIREFAYTVSKSDSNSVAAMKQMLCTFPQVKLALTVLTGTSNGLPRGEIDELVGCTLRLFRAVEDISIDIVPKSMSDRKQRTRSLGTFLQEIPISTNRLAIDFGDSSTGLTVIDSLQRHIAHLVHLRSLKVDNRRALSTDLHKMLNQHTLSTSLCIPQSFCSAAVQRRVMREWNLQEVTLGLSALITSDVVRFLQVIGEAISAKRLPRVITLRSIRLKDVHDGIRSDRTLSQSIVDTFIPKCDQKAVTIISALNFQS